MRQTALIIFLLCHLTMLNAIPAALAEEINYGLTLVNPLFGATDGTLVGQAVIAFNRKPSDDINKLVDAPLPAISFPSGSIAKTTLGFDWFGKSNIRITMPKIIPSIFESPVTRQTTITWRAEILCGTFN